MSLKIRSQEEFCNAIEAIVANSPSPEEGYIEAITSYCYDNNIDMEVVPKLLTKNLKKKIEAQALEMNLIKGKKKKSKKITSLIWG